MKILMLTPRFPYPPTRGDTLRSWGQLDYLARRHDVWLASANERLPYPAQLARVRELCRDVVIVPRGKLRGLARGALALLRGRSLTEGFFSSKTLAERVRTWTSSVAFDAVLTFSSAMAPFAELVEARRVLDMVDVDSHKWRVYARRSRPPLRWAYALESRRLAAAERRWVQAHDVTLVVNEREHRKLPPVSPSRSGVIRSSVELAELRPARPSSARAALPAEPIIGCVGSMFYPPNVRAVEWFGRKVWPTIRVAVPEAKWWIVGNRPVRRVRRWSRDPRITVTGFVPDVRPYLDAMRVFVNPVDGDIGVQSKLLLAMAAGKPAVVTPDCADGIDYAGLPPFVVAASPADFADAVIRVLRDEALVEQLSNRSRQVIEDLYKPEDQLYRMDRWLAGQPVVERRPDRTGERPAAPEQADASPRANHPAEVHG